MKLNIRTKLLLGSIVLVLLFSTLQFLIYEVTRDHTILHIGIIQLEKAKTGSIQLGNFFTNLETTDKALAQYYRENYQTDTAKVADATVHAVGNSQYINKIAFLTRSGKEVVKVDKLGPVTESELSYEIPTEAFESALTGKSSVSKVYYTEGTFIPHFDLFYPIFSNDASVIGVIKTQVNLENLWSILSKVTSGEHDKEGLAYVVDNEGRLIAHPDQKYVEERPDLSGRSSIAQLLANPTQSQTGGTFEYQNQQNVKVFSQAVRIPDTGWIVVFEEPEAEALSIVTYISNILLVSYAGLFVIVIVIAIIFSINITNPIKELQEATNRLKQGSLDTRTSISSGDEVEALGDAFNTMAQSLQNAFENLDAQKKRSDKTAELLLKRDMDVRNINDELEAERDKLENERNKLRLTLFGITDAVISLDLHQRIIAMNKAAEEMLGISEEEAFGKEISTIFRIYNGEEEIPASEYAPTAGEGNGIVYSNTGLKVVTRHMSHSINIISGKLLEGKKINLGCIITLHDVTKENQLEAMRLDFVSMAAHELRTPLTTIRSYLSVFIQENYPVLNDEQRTFISKIYSSTIQLTYLIENLLDVTKIEKGTFVISATPVDWLKYIKPIVTDLQSRAKEKNIELELVEPANPLPKVNIDVIRINEVVLNLIANAINYTEKGKITVSVEEKDGYIITHVHDTGEGIPPEALPNLFTKFFRVVGRLTQGTKGTGLGLYISKSIIEKHKGKIWAESEGKGKGATFSFSLPISTTTPSTSLLTPISK